jgi:hypothetical protein
MSIKQFYNSALSTQSSALSFGGFTGGDLSAPAAVAPGRMIDVIFSHNHAPRSNRHEPEQYQYQ